MEQGCFDAAGKATVAVFWRPVGLGSANAASMPGLMAESVEGSGKDRRGGERREREQNEKRLEQEVTQLNENTSGGAERVPSGAREEQ